MRILQLNFEKGWRGGEQQTLLCMQQFRAGGHAVTLLARENEALAKAAKADGFEVHEYQTPFGFCGFLLRNGRSFDILHAQTANSITWLVLLKQWLRRPIVFTRRTAFPITKHRNKTQWKWQNTDLLVAVCEAATDEPRSMGLDAVVIRSAVMPKPANSERAQAFSAHLGLQNKKVIATAAALTREKDPCTLIRAIHHLKKTRDDFVFVHCGAGGDVEEAAKKLVKELGLEEHYLFAGFQPNMADLYTLMDVFVLTSIAEAAGGSVLDAFLYSVPVVSTNAGGLREALRDGRGVLCEIGDHVAIANGIQRMLDDSEFRQSAVQKAYAYVRQEHDVTEMGRRYLKEFERLTSQ